MKMSMRWLLVIGIVLTAAPAWAADGSAMLDKHVRAINRTARTSEGQQVVVQRLSQELGIPAQTLQAQRQQTGLGWGEILIANRLSQKTGTSFDQIVSEFRSGKGWGAIAREHDLKLGKLVSEVSTTHRAIRTSIQASGRGASHGGGSGITSAANRTETNAGGASGFAGHAWGR